MHISPDQTIFWQYGFFKLNATILFTWALMIVLAVGSRLVTRKLSTGLERSRWQNLLEILVTGIEKQIEEVGLSEPRKYIGFLGTLFVFVAVSQHLYRDSRLRSADRLALHHGCARAVGIRGRAVLRHRGARRAQLPQVLCHADAHDAAV